jgi:hypothetical protein
MVRVVLQDRTDLPDSKIQTLLEINKCLGTPDLPGDFLAGHDFSLAADQ